MLPGEGDAGRRDGAERPGGAGVVPEPESQGENKQVSKSQQLCSVKAADKSAAPRRVLKKKRIP